MELTCPHCGKVNKVAGYYPADPEKGNVSSSGEDRKLETVYCGFCGNTFTPRPTISRSVPGEGK